MAEKRKVTITDFLTGDEIARAKEMWSNDRERYAHRVCEDIIRPVIVRINEGLGQDNDPMYLAYLVEYFMTLDSERPNSYKVEVVADSTGNWIGNALRFATQSEAESYANDLFHRWTSVRETRVLPSPDRANATFFRA